MFKRNKIELQMAERAIEYYKSIPLKFVDVDLYKWVELAHKYNIYAYDAYFLECARDYKSPLLTVDSRLHELAKQININVIEV